MKRLYSLPGISLSILRRRGPGKKADPAVHDNHMNRYFVADAINVKWLVDITEHRTSKGKYNLGALKGGASNRL